MLTLDQLAISKITEIAGQVISQHLGEALRLGAEKIFPTWGSVVVRCRLIDGPSDLPRTYIIKKVREDTVRYAPDSSEAPNSAHWFFNDWAAAKFLGEIPTDFSLSPFCYGGSRSVGRTRPDEGSRLN